MVFQVLFNLKCWTVKEKNVKKQSLFSLSTYNNRVWCTFIYQFFLLFLYREFEADAANAGRNCIIRRTHGAGVVHCRVNDQTAYHTNLWQLPWCLIADEAIMQNLWEYNSKVLRKWSCLCRKIFFIDQHQSVCTPSLRK